VSKAPGQPVSKAPGQPPAAKPVPSTAKGDYAVRVGTTYKNKSEAETVRKDLTRKGYSAIVRAAPGGYSVITNPIPERKAYTLQEQMRIQGVGNTSVIKATPVPGPAKKLPTGKPANGKNGISPDPGSEIR
jgi:cell division protein FtsN